jgi:tryptophan-rich sensory protein
MEEIMSISSDSWKRWFFCVFVCLLIGGIGSIAHHATVGTWYAALIKPIGTPPNWVFPLVWTAIYIMIGTSWWLFWEAPGFGKASGWMIFFAQLFLNFLWPWIFFWMEHTGVAFAELVVLWFAILVNVFLFARHSWTAATLLLPYLAWVTYAGYLNFGIWFMNS